MNSKERRTLLLSQGLCEKSCGRNIEKPYVSRCVECGDKQKRARALKRQSGICRDCQEPVHHLKGTYCLTHQVRMILNNVLSRKPTASEIDIIKNRLIASPYCPYTGEKIDVALGYRISAELDHIYPCSRFPELSQDINNLEWISSGANRAKEDRTKQEFLEFCANITRRNS